MRACGENCRIGRPDAARSERGDRRRGRAVPAPREYCEIAREVGATEETVRYQIRKLVRLGYLRACTAGYEPTGKVLFIPDGGEAAALTSIEISPHTGS